MNFEAFMLTIYTQCPYNVVMQSNTTVQSHFSTLFSTLIRHNKSYFVPNKTKNRNMVFLDFISG